MIRENLPTYRPSTKKWELIRGADFEGGYISKENDFSRNTDGGRRFYTADFDGEICISLKYRGKKSRIKDEGRIEFGVFKKNGKRCGEIETVKKGERLYIKCRASEVTYYPCRLKVLLRKK